MSPWGAIADLFRTYFVALQDPYLNTNTAKVGRINFLHVSIEQCRYGDGQCGQGPVPRTPHCIQPQCEHAEFNWTRLPFLTLHAHGLQMHDWNYRDLNDELLQSMADLLGLHSRFGSQLLATFQSRVRAASVHQQWAKMKCLKSRYVAFMVICRRCQRLTWAARKPDSTPGHVDHECANLLAFFQLPVPAILNRPLETTLPRV
jgi:hypothetical protein